MKIPEEIFAEKLSIKAQEAEFKYEAALTVNHTYQSMIDLMKTVNIYDVI